ncbi:MAG: hypothetical protein Q9207_008011 [Kuettlingeria erythrocarpa]
MLEKGLGSGDPPSVDNSKSTPLQVESSVATSASKLGTSDSVHVEDFPKGFPRLACFLDSDDTFMVYKRFGVVFSRLLLNKQDEVRELEMKLLAMDRADNNEAGAGFLMSRSDDVQRDQDSRPSWWDETRPALLLRLEKKVLEYCEAF